jgi:hypothetical protein
MEKPAGMIEFNLSTPAMCLMDLPIGTCPLESSLVDMPSPSPYLSKPCS